MNPLFWLALLKEIAVPELQRWLSQLHAEGRIVTEEEAMAKLNRDADDVIAVGKAFLDTTGGA
jgi:hypothetical protein